MLVEGGIKLSELLTPEKTGFVSTTKNIILKILANKSIEICPRQR